MEIASNEYERGKRHLRAHLWAMARMTGEPPQDDAQLLSALLNGGACRVGQELPERHEYVRAYHCGPDNGPRLVLRSEALARAVSSLARWSLTSPGYLHEIDSELGWWRACDAPAFSLPEKVEDDIVEEIGHAMDARDMAGALEVVRRVLDTTTPSEPATEKPYTANDAASVRQDVVRFLRPVLASLRAAMGLPALEHEPVHQHELYAELKTLVRDIEATRNAALWLAAWQAQTNDVRGFFLARLAERGGIGFDLASLMSSWYRYRRSLTSDITMSEVETFAKRLRGDD